MPPLKALGSFLPEIRWKPRSPPAPPAVSIVDLEAPEKRLRNEGTERDAIGVPDEASGSLSAVSVSCKRPLRRLWRLMRKRMSQRRMAVPAREPMTEPTMRGVVTAESSSLDEVVAASVGSEPGGAFSPM